MAAAALFAALALAAGPAAAQVPDPFARDLAQKLARVEVDLVDQGYAHVAGPFVGNMASGTLRAPRTIMLRAGQDFQIAGVCDSRCRDLDLRLRDPRGTLIAADLQGDPTPLMHVRPAFTGPHTIEIAMIDCAAERCWYAVNVYSR
jgi:hypothetical protein